VPPLEAQRGWTRPAEFVICEQPIEEIFGWIKTVGGLRKTRYRGLERVGFEAYLVGAAYNLARLARLTLLIPSV
jgi:IS5 family transposase